MWQAIYNWWTRFQQPALRYELFRFQDDSQELWRIWLKKPLYPESFFNNKWISDFGLGNYQHNRRLAREVRELTTSEVAKLLPTYKHFDEGHDAQDLVV